MTEVLLTGLKIGESARWHDGRLWLSHWGAQQILAVDLGGNAEVMATVPTTMPFSIDWLPDGRLLVVAGPEGRLLRQEPDGSLVDHADLSGLGAGLNEIVVDGRGRDRVPQRDGGHPGRLHADRLGVVRGHAHRVRHRPRREPVEPAGVGRAARRRHR